MVQDVTLAKKELCVALSSQICLHLLQKTSGLFFRMPWKVASAVASNARVEKSDPGSDRQSVDGSVEKPDGTTRTTTTPTGGEFSYTEEESSKLLHKIDWRIMPYLWGYAVLSAVDVCVHQILSQSELD